MSEIRSEAAHYRGPGVRGQISRFRTAMGMEDLTRRKQRRQVPHPGASNPHEGHDGLQPEEIRRPCPDGDGAEGVRPFSYSDWRYGADLRGGFRVPDGR